MADEVPVQRDNFPVRSSGTGPTAVEAFVADRQTMWSSFTSMTMYVVIGVAVLLIAMTVFLV